MIPSPGPGASGSEGIKTNLPGVGGQTGNASDRPSSSDPRAQCSWELREGVEGRLSGRGDCKQTQGRRAGHPVTGAFYAGEPGSS